MNELSLYAGTQPGPLPLSELVARAQITIPLFPGLSGDDQDRVVAALADGLEQCGAPR
jgi:dTDP-4-amino-4,6-dideoxygalactose transaminase